MRALISGQAGIAAILSKKTAFRRVDGRHFFGPRRDVADFFRDCGDLIEVDVASMEEADRILGREWALDRAIFLLFLLLDRPSTDEAEIVRTIIALVADHRMEEELRDRLTMVSVPSSVRARAAIVSVSYPMVERYVDCICPGSSADSGHAGHSIRIAIVGIGNCASSLVQGLEYYHEGTNDTVGLMHRDMGGYKPSDIGVVAAWDVDSRKVGKDVAEAIFAKPNCTAVFAENVQATGTVVRMGKVLDGVAEHMSDRRGKRVFLVADEAQPTKDDVVKTLKDSGAHVLMNYLPVGSQKATEFYAECAIEAGVAFVNNIPVFIASNPEWAAKFEAAGVPIIGDDIKAQLGATIVHRVLTDLFAKRGVKLERTYQLNTGGNTDFLNMSNHRRLESNKISKTEAVQSVAAERMEDDNVHIGPSDYVPWQNDNKVCFLRMEGTMFGGVPMNLEMRLSVEDSPNSAGVAIDMIRCAKIARDRGLAGVIDPASAYYCKHPRTQMTDDRAHDALNDFVRASAA